MQNCVRRWVRTGVLLMFTGGVVSASPAGQAASRAADQAADLLRSVQNTFTIDFNGLPVGQRVSQVSVGEGVISISAQRRDRPGDSNRAMIFDAECGGLPEGCSGNDDDLYAPGQGNLLIVSQDNNSADPNDNHEGGHVNIDFSSFGSGSVRVVSFKVFDVSHKGAVVSLYADGEIISNIPIPRGGTGEQTTVEVDTPGVDLMRVTVADSFALDDIVFEVP
jgi:serine-aspartate repeat-containing protein C/D/E